MTWNRNGRWVGYVAAAVGLSACSGTASQPVFIDKVLAPFQETRGVCDYTGDLGQPSISRGVVDLVFPLATYSPVFLIGDRATSPFPASAETTGLSPVILGGSSTRVTDPSGNDVAAMLEAMCSAGDAAACETEGVLADHPPVNAFSTGFGALPVADGSTPSYMAGPLIVLDQVTVSALRYYFETRIAAKASTPPIALLTYTKVTGEILGGSTFESDEVAFPVTVTYGGLASNLELRAGALCVLATPVSADPTCVPGQDAPAAAAPSPVVPACQP
jgi:hypothetical protein